MTVEVYYEIHKMTLFHQQKTKDQMNVNIYSKVSGTLQNMKLKQNSNIMCFLDPGTIISLCLSTFKII